MVWNQLKMTDLKSASARQRNDRFLSMKILQFNMKSNYIPLFVILLVGIVFISGCTSQTGNENSGQQSQQVTCNKPYILVGTSCCLDQNDNSICDNDETPKCTPNWKCSSWSDCSQTGTQTRTCTDENNCGVTTNKPTESQTCTPPSKSWHTVTTLTSSTSKKTDTFNIKGEKWKFTWSCDKANDYDGMNIAVYEQGSSSYTEFLFMQKCPETEETTFVYAGAGDYYFDISIANVNSWTIKVEDWY